LIFVHLSSWACSYARTILDHELIRWRLRSSLRNRLLLTFVALVITVGAGTLFAIVRTLADDLTSSLDTG